MEKYIRKTVTVSEERIIRALRKFISGIFFKNNNERLSVMNGLVALQPLKLKNHINLLQARNYQILFTIYFKV